MQEIVKSPSKHYSPLRYPGGKAGLSGYLSTLIKNNNIKTADKAFYLTVKKLI